MGSLGIDYSPVAAQLTTDPNASAAADKAAFLAKYQAQHDIALTDRKNLILGIARLNSSWQNLPLGPYPPAGDNSGWPRTGSPQLIVSATSLSKAQLAEPGKITKALADQASARRPQIGPLFWVGLAALGAGIYVLKRSR